MHTKHTTMGAALVTALALISIGAVPVGAVPADCTKDFEIQTGKPTLPRTLAVEASETGWIEVTGSGTTIVEIELDSLNSILRFGIFVLDGIDCDPAGAKSIDCDDDEVLDTVNGPFPDSMTCELESDEVYYFHFVNDGSNILSYRAWD